MNHDGSPLRSGTDPSSRRIEVNRVVTDEGSYVLLQDLHYGPGVGWYAQKTIRLDPAQVDALMRELCCARSANQPRPISQRDGGCRCAEETSAGAASKSLTLPTNLEERRRRETRDAGADIIEFPSGGAPRD